MVIVDKLGYSFEDVKKQVHHSLRAHGGGENVSASFVANLYFRLHQEEETKALKKTNTQS